MRSTACGGTLDTNSTEVRPNLILNNDYKDFTVLLKDPVKCIKTGARRYQMEVGGLRFQHNNVDVFECPGCGRKLCR